MNDKSKHNACFLDILNEHGGENAARLGPYGSYIWRNDAKHLLFTLARYKFCAKMLSGVNSAVEVGCGDGLGISVLLQEVNTIYGVDVVEEVINYNTRNNIYGSNVSYACQDITLSPLKQRFDAAISLDVIEHIPHEKEISFIRNIALSLTDHGVCIIGTPNITASAYAGELNRKEHINLKSHTSLKDSLKIHFHNVFLFSMNDEVVHTGFYPMAHYLLALAVAPRR